MPTLERVNSASMIWQECAWLLCMTTHGDQKIWQDVYHARTETNDEVYLKLTVIDSVLIVSFKEL